MFGWTDFLFLVVSLFIILPIVVFIRELGYFIAGVVVGAKNLRITIGSGPRLIKKGPLDIRRHYHLYSWFSYDRLEQQGKLAYVFLYASPILINVLLGAGIILLLDREVLPAFEEFWDRFLFYIFFYVLFDAVPMKMVYGRPNNGLILYEMLRYGKRVDTNKEPFLPSTSEIEEAYQKDMKELQKELKEKHPK